VSVLESPEKDSYLYVTLETVAETWKFTDWHEPDDDDFVYKKMSVKIGDSVGTFQDSQTEIELELGDAFTSFAVLPPLPKIEVTIVERTQAVGSDTADELVLFKGRVAKVIKNQHGKEGSVVLICLPMKALLDVPLGLLCTQQCVWNFGGKGCNFDVAAERQIGTLTEINTDRTVTIPGLAPVARANFWRQGYVTRNGLKIVIREWDPSVDTDRFLLRERPPAEWIGQEVELTPGCDKSLGNCRDWDNEERFAGLGIAMPDYHPNIEG